MKQFLFILSLLTILTLNGCVQEGPRGPQGPQGPEGPAGLDAEMAHVFEFENINFTSPTYEVFLDYPNDFDGLDSDVALIYLLWGTDNVNGEDVDVWRQLPQNVLTENGLLIYDFDFTKNDVRLFLDADYPLDLLTAIDTDDWIARVVVVPGEFWASNRMSKFIDYQELKETLNLPNLPVHHTIMMRRSIEVTD